MLQDSLSMNTKIEKKGHVESLLYTATNLIQAGRLVDAESICQDILKAYPNQADAIYLLATIAFRQNKPKVAINLVNKAITIHPISANYYLLLGDIYTKLGRLNDAINSCLKSIKLNPEYAEAYNNLGILYREQGKYDASKKAFDKAISINPQRGEFLNNRAVIALDENVLDKAEDLLKKAIDMNPDYIDAHSNLGKVLINKGQLDEAIKCFEKIILLNQTYKTAYFDLGRIYNLKNNLNVSKEYYLKALHIDNNYYDALFNLGIIYISLGENKNGLDALNRCRDMNPGDTNIYRYLGLASSNLDKPQDAIRYYKIALNFDDDYQILINLGAVYFKQDRYRDAIKTYEKAIKINPDSYHAYSNMGIALAYAGLRDPDMLEDNYEYHDRDKNIKKAELYVKKAIELNPDFPDAYSNLWVIYRHLGKKKEALECCNKAIALNPNSAIALFNATTSTQHSADNTGHKDKLEELLNTNLNDEDKLHCHFALARIYNDLNNYKKAIYHAKIANKIKNGHVRFDFEHYQNYINKIIHTFTDEFIKEKSSYGNRSETPVFIVGMPRSGTTLVEQIIATHPDAYAVGEVSYLHMLEGMLPKYMNSSEQFINLFQHINKDVINNISEQYLKLISPGSGSALRITDKMPNNFLSIGFIKILFPNAHIINCVRNPPDIFISIYFLLFTLTNEYAYDMTSIIRYFNEYERLMKYWESLDSLKVHNVVYEDLVQNQEDVSKEIIEFIGLDWDSRCLTFYKNRRPARTASTDQITKPIYKTSINRWKNYESFLKPFLDKSY